MIVFTVKKNNPEVYTETEKAMNRQSNLEWKNKAGEITIPGFKIHFGAITQTAWSLSKDTDLGQNTDPGSDCASTDSQQEHKQHILHEGQSLQEMDIHSWRFKHDPHFSKDPQTMKT